MGTKHAIHGAQSLSMQAMLLEEIALQLSMRTRKQLILDLEDFGLTLPQYINLRAIKDHPQGCRMSSLADASYHAPPTITGIVDQLVLAGWVIRARDPEDRRSVLVSITAAGQELMDRISTRRRAYWVQALQALPKTDRTLLLKALQSMLHELQPG